MKSTNHDTSSKNEREVKLCPDCDGEGFFIYVGGPGYFCPSFGNYLPSEHLIRCETCNGYGELDPWEDDPQPPCLEDEDDLDYDEAELPF